MPEPAVVNSSPLIFLSKAGLLDWLQLAADTVLVPEAVAREINRRGPADVTVNALTRTSWVRIVAVPAIPPVIQSWDLGPGESAVLAHAYTHPGAVAIIDDGLGRRCADLLGIPLQGYAGTGNDRQAARSHCCGAAGGHYLEVAGHVPVRPGYRPCFGADWGIAH